MIDNDNSDLATPSIDAGTGVLTVSYLSQWHGSATIIVRANDGTGSTLDESFTVTVTAVNDAPVIDAISDPAAILEDGCFPAA